MGGRPFHAGAVRRVGRFAWGEGLSTLGPPSVASGVEVLRGEKALPAVRCFGLGCRLSPCDKRMTTGKDNKVALESGLPKMTPLG